MFGMVPFRKNNNNLSRKGDYFNQLFNDDFFNDDLMSPFTALSDSFRVDLKEDENNYMVEADLPGIKKDAVDLTYENNYLTISAKRDDSTEEKDDNYVRRERRYGEFNRSFYIDNVDDKNIDAEFTNGVLKIVLPKIQKGMDPKNRINIR